jgi:hypothetical protein
MTLQTNIDQKECVDEWKPNVTDRKCRWKGKWICSSEIERQISVTDISLLDRLTKSNILSGCGNNNKQWKEENHGKFRPIKNSMLNRRPTFETVSSDDQKVERLIYNRRINNRRKQMEIRMIDGNSKTGDIKNESFSSDSDLKYVFPSTFQNSWNSVMM